MAMLVVKPNRLAFLLLGLLCSQWSCTSSLPSRAPTVVATASVAPRVEAATSQPDVSPPALFSELVARVGDASYVQLAAANAELPDALRNLDYDAYRDIRFRPERSLWRGEPGRFEVQFFHPGLYYRELVDVFVADGDGVYPFPFSTQLFDYGALTRPESGAGLGFTGLRVHAPFEQTDYRDEVIVFQGASYFRSRGRGQVYGLSARGLSIDMGADKPEEFPRFDQLFLVRPDEDDASMWIVATLASARAKGVFAFRVTPDDVTVVEVFAHVWLTAPVDALGLAPLSSMYWFGEEAPASFGDFRPEVHDSDGMAFLSEGGEWLFRPLRNPARNTRTEHRLDSPRGFGLLQRDRDFASYQDLEARYQDRPSVWVEPIGDWGNGALHLLELHTDVETNDNIALAWAPDHVSEQGIDLHYKLHFGAMAGTLATPAGVVAATRIARTETGARFVIDFVGDAMLTAESSEAQVDVTGARVVEQHVEANPLGGSRRVSFEIACDVPRRDVELRAFLYRRADVLSETWSYLWQSCP